MWLGERIIPKSQSRHGSINKCVTPFYVHRWYHGNWSTLEEPLTIYLISYMQHLCQWGAVLDLQPHFSIYQWCYTLDWMIIYIYVNLYTKTCYLHYWRNNRMEKFHWTMLSSELITSCWLTCWWNNYTSLYNTKVFCTLLRWIGTCHQIYIDVWRVLLCTITEILQSQKYFYITNRLTLEEDYKAIYTPTTNTKSNYLTKTIDWELIDINKLEMNKMNSIKSVISKQVRL